MNKEHNERLILAGVYKEHSHLEITQSDKPDFIIQDYTKIEYGVEVTDFYVTKTNARLDKIPDYRKELLDKKKFRHKADRRILKVDNIKIVNKKNKTSIEVPVIIQESTKRSKFLDEIYILIKRKNVAFEQYNPNLAHIKLIIKDNSGHNYRFENEGFFSYFFNKEVIKEIAKSPFREIFFLSKKDKDIAVFNLKQELLLAQIYLFEELIKKEPIEIEELSSFYTYFSDFLLYQEFKGLKLVKQGEKLELIYGKTGFILENWTKIILQDYQDESFPPHVQIDQTQTEFMNKQRIKTLNNIYTTFKFSTKTER